MAQDLGARRTEVSIIGNSRRDPSSPRLFAAKVGGEGVWEWAGAVRAFARMPTLATMRQSRRWVTPGLGHPPYDRATRRTAVGLHAYALDQGLRGKSGKRGP